MDNECRFWNDKKTVGSFVKQPISEYWLESFSQIKSAKSKIVLDLGCGGGRNSEMLDKLGFDVYSCDAHLGMVKATKDRLVSLGKSSSWVNDRIIQSKMSSLPYKNNFFDFVLSHGVYHNATSNDEFETAFRETSRVLKPGGKLFFNLFSSNYLASDYSKDAKEDDLYVTKEKLFMILKSKQQFLQIAKKFNLIPNSEVIEYYSDVSTGKRSVMRGILVKIRE